MQILPAQNRRVIHVNCFGNYEEDSPLWWNHRGGNRSGIDFRLSGFLHHPMRFGMLKSAPDA